MSRRENGVALVLAMGVVALATIAATAILVTQSAWSRQHELAAGHAQSRALIDGAIDWARSVLADDRRASTFDHLGEAWALRLAPMPVDNGEIAGHIEDQQGLFNLNNLVREGKVSPTQLGNLKRLLATLGLPGALADALATAKLPLADFSELALVRGFDDDVRARLRGYVTVLPAATLVNVNTAPPEVIAALVEGLDIGEARELAARRGRTVFRSVAEFTRELPRSSIGRAEDLTVSSDYFLVVARARIGEAQARATALVVREDRRWPNVVWRKFL